MNIIYDVSSHKGWCVIIETPCIWILMFWYLFIWIWFFLRLCCPRWSWLFQSVLRNWHKWFDLLAGYHMTDFAFLKNAIVVHPTVDLEYLTIKIEEYYCEENKLSFIIHTQGDSRWMVLSRFTADETHDRFQNLVINKI